MAERRRAAAIGRDNEPPRDAAVGHSAGSSADADANVRKSLEGAGFRGVFEKIPDVLQQLDLPKNLKKVSQTFTK